MALDAIKGQGCQWELFIDPVPLTSLTAYPLRRANGKLGLPLADEGGATCPAIFIFYGRI